MSKYLLTLLAVLSLAGLLFAAPGAGKGMPKRAFAAARLGQNRNIEAQPTWQKLAQMDLMQRANARIEIGLNADLPESATSIARNIEELWNSGRSEEAIARFADLQPLMNIDEIGIGIAWRIPVTAKRENSTVLWDSDIQINNQDSVYATALCSHRASGNLFVVLLLQDGNWTSLSVNHSTDEGMSWSETYYWISPDPMVFVGAAVVGNNCYVVFPYQNSARLKCFDVTDGHAGQFPDSSTYATIFTAQSPDSIKEVSLVSNQDALNNRLYCLAITSQGRLRYFWANQEALDWSEVSTGISNADRALDASFNESFTNYYLFISYIDQTDKLSVFGRRNYSIQGRDEAGTFGR
jgi:hypothetical protein